MEWLLSATNQFFFSSPSSNDESVLVSDDVITHDIIVAGIGRPRFLTDTELVLGDFDSQPCLLTHSAFHLQCKLLRSPSLSIVYIFSVSQLPSLPYNLGEVGHP